MFTFLTVVVAAIIFEYSNGFHDAANAIATVVSTKVLTPRFVNTLFGKLQIFSAAWMAHSHGSNDAQKTMGIIALALFTGTKAGSFDHLPSFLAFLRTPTFILPVWVVAVCALTMAVGT